MQSMSLQSIRVYSELNVANLELVHWILTSNSDGVSTINPRGFDSCKKEGIEELANFLDLVAQYGCKMENSKMITTRGKDILIVSVGEKLTRIVVDGIFESDEYLHKHAQYHIENGHILGCYKTRIKGR